MALSEPAEFGHPDFILLEKVNEAAFMANLKLRFEKGKVRDSSCLSFCKNRLLQFLVS